MKMEISTEIIKRLANFLWNIKGLTWDFLLKIYIPTHFGTWNSTTTNWQYKSLCKIRCNKFNKLLDTVRCLFYGLFMVRSFVVAIHRQNILALWEMNCYRDNNSLNSMLIRRLHCNTIYTNTCVFYFLFGK